MKEGDLYTVKSARILGDVGGMSAELAPILDTIQLNGLFRRANVLEVEQRIKSKLGERGYATAQVNVHPTFDEQDKTISLDFIVEAGKVIRFAKFVLKAIQVVQIAPYVRKCVNKKALGYPRSWLS